ncbi:hypothetical protein DLD82_07805 [Methanospirillum stamsii]|uniref:DUF8173 domain-containing protein n=2 Tax=Methanospirillum stamsii TaxID=1277351 RepID=A0A2V2NGQ5_9EURY|nr:hypothetical protein DLD82_07805 [Methanospirillum stamsii]
MAFIICAGLIAPASAFDSRSGDNIVIDEPIDDDLIASGGSMIVNAPVKSITWAGGTLIVNEPVETNLIAAGGTIQVNAPVGTDLVACGGNIDVNSDVGGKILAIGGTVTVSGNAENVAASGGTVILGKNAVISKDVIIGSSGYTTQGTIHGNLTIENEDESSIDMQEFGNMVSSIVTITMLICTFGFLILGIILVKICPDLFNSILRTGTEKTLLSLVAGIAGLVLGFILFVILLITIIGIPLACFLFLLIILGLFLSTIVSGAILGSWIFQMAKKDMGLIIGFVVGFIVLNILFFIPFIGFIFWIIAVFLGFGTLILTFYDAYSSS